ncbi:MAG: DUF6067 family protein [Armatimonadetes bacterium]|nr:DUF6067 family protein [Armatimonadota bacterium]MDW8122811.1 DUF6067 family protein [Armatimonadota bacterium]
MQCDFRLIRRVLAVLMLTAVTSAQTNDPVWLTSPIYDHYAVADRVPAPWTPVRIAGKTLSVWGRSFIWSPQSLLPSRIISQNRDVLAQPLFLVLSEGSKEATVPLKAFQLVERKKSRLLVRAQGAAKGFSFSLLATLEFDGFLWLRLEGKDESGRRRPVQLRIIASLPAPTTTLYQTFSRPLAGWIGSEPIPFSWVCDPNNNIVNFYHWFGDEDGGLGFTYSTLENWVPLPNDTFATFFPGPDHHRYVIHLLEQPLTLDGRSFLFGIQPTPIKPLPPDFPMIKGATLFTEPWRAIVRLAHDTDMTLIWPVPVTKAMKSLNDPFHIDHSIVDESRKTARSLGIPFVGVAHCPQKISPLIPEFSQYADDWKVIPESVMDWEKIPHYQNCGKSYTLRKWLFYGWAIENVLKRGWDGLYSDGWMTGQIACSNPRHGCGWTDQHGRRHLTVPVLEGREFNRVMALFLEDHVRSPLPSTAPQRPGFPRYHFWIHSWEFVPPLMGFGTAWLTGEFAGWPLKGPSMLTPEGTYARSLGLGLFRARCLSTNWGVPNLFDPLMGEASENHPTDRQTRMALAWFLPHGVPIGLFEYLNSNTFVRIMEIFLNFQARKAQFYPCWRENPYLSIDDPKDKEIVLGLWVHPDQKRLLAVVSNLKESQEAAVRLLWKKPIIPILRDAETGDSIRPDGSLFPLPPLSPENFRLLLIDIR